MRTDSSAVDAVEAPAPASDAAKRTACAPGQETRRIAIRRWRWLPNPTHAAPYAVLLGFAAAILWPLCIGRSLYWGDILLYFDVMARFVGTTLRQGHLPLWNPYMLCGQPYVGNPQSALFYPTTALLFFVPEWLYLSLNSVLHLFLCGAFAYVFLRRWTLRRVSALAGALVYMGSACLVGRLQFPPMLQTAPYFPLVLACLDRCIDRPGLATALLLALVVGLTVLAAHTQVCYLIFVCVAFYALMRLWATHHQQKRFITGQIRRARWRQAASPALIWMLTASLLGLLLASIHLLPALQLLRESPREEMTLRQANRFVLEPAQLLTLIWPHFMGHPTTADYWGDGNAWEPALFIGWLPLLLIGYAAARCNREGLVRYWLIVGLVGIWLALGDTGGLYQLAFWTVPGLSLFHDPARFLFITTFACAVLTAVGLDALRLRRGNRRMDVLALLVIAAPLWWYGQEWNPTVPPQELTYRPAVVPILRKDIGEPSPNAGRIYLPGRELSWKQYIAAGYMDYGPSDPRNMDALFDTLMPNLGMRYDLESASAYEPVPVAAMADLDGLAQNALHRGAPNLTHLLGLLNIETLILPEEMRAADPGLKPLLPATPIPTVRLWHNQKALPRAWMVRRTRHIEGRLRIMAALTAPDFQPQEMVVISGLSKTPTEWERRLSQAAVRPQTRADLEWGTATDESVLPEPVTILARDAGSIRLRADAGNAPAFLVYSGTAYPGWKAKVDGHPTPLIRTDGALLGTYLSPGRHAVQLDYAPDVVRIGLYLSLLSVGILAAGAACLLTLRRGLKSAS